MSDVSDLVAKCGGEFFPWMQGPSTRRISAGGHVNLRHGACGEFSAVWLQNVRARQEVPTNQNMLDDAQWIRAASTVPERRYFPAYFNLKLSIFPLSAFLDKYTG